MKSEFWDARYDQTYWRAEAIEAASSQFSWHKEMLMKKAAPNPRRFVIKFQYVAQLFHPLSPCNFLTGSH